MAPIELFWYVVAVFAGLTVGAIILAFGAFLLLVLIGVSNIDLKEINGTSNKPSE